MTVREGIESAWIDRYDVLQRTSGGGENTGKREPELYAARPAAARDSSRDEAAPMASSHPTREREFKNRRSTEWLRTRENSPLITSLTTSSLCCTKNQKASKLWIAT